MRVCFISFEYPPNILGGAGTYAEVIVKGLRSKGIDIVVLTRGHSDSFEKDMFRLPTYNMPYLRRLLFMKPALSLFQQLNKRFEFDLVHFNEPHILFGKPNLPTVCTVHSTQVNEIKLKLASVETLRTAVDVRELVLKSPVGSIGDILAAHSTDKIICPSPYLAGLIKSYCFVDQQKISVIPNGIDLQAFEGVENCDHDVLSRYDLETDNYLLFIGRLSYLKGVQYLIEAFRAIKKEYHDLKLVIVGSGEYENHLRSLTKGIQDVIFAGYVDSLKVKKTLYDNCLAVFVPSLYEALPMVVIEAMACRKAVVASDVGGIPLLVKHGKNGFLTRPRDSKGLQECISMLYNNENLRRSMGSFGRELVEREFTVDIMVDRTLKVYESLQ